MVRFAPIPLTIGKRYELSGWVRTEDLVGAGPGPLADRRRRRAHHGLHAVRRALRLARRHPAVDPPLAEIRRQPRAGPDPAHRRQRRRLPRQGVVRRRQPRRSLLRRTNGPRAKRSRRSVRPTAIPRPAGSTCTSKATPYERGYQHGHLMAREIPEYLERCAADLGSQGAVERIPHHRQRPLPARLRSRNPGRDARHRRRRVRRRRQVAGPPHRPDGHRGGQHHRRTGRIALRRR